MLPLTKTAVVRHEKARDRERIEALLDSAFGPDRHKSKTAYRLREGVDPVRELCYVVEYSEPDNPNADPNTERTANNEIAATIRYWPVLLPSGAFCLLLGPIAVEEVRKNEGIGASLMTFSMNQAKALGYPALLLVGDQPYYQRFGFTREVMKGLQLPGPVDESRFLGLEFIPGSLANEQGVIRKWPSGRLLPHYKKNS
jgi:predicted N-acetyltransferase YhbS